MFNLTLTLFSCLLFKHWGENDLFDRALCFPWHCYYRLALCMRLGDALKVWGLWCARIVSSALPTTDRQCVCSIIQMAEYQVFFWILFPIDIFWEATMVQIKRSNISLLFILGHVTFIFTFTLSVWFHSCVQTMIMSFIPGTTSPQLDPHKSWSVMWDFTEFPLGNNDMSNQIPNLH